MVCQSHPWGIFLTGNSSLAWPDHLAPSRSRQQLKLVMLYSPTSKTQLLTSNKKRNKTTYNQNHRNPKKKTKKHQTLFNPKKQFPPKTSNKKKSPIFSQAFSSTLNFQLGFPQGGGSQRGGQGLASAATGAGSSGATGERKGVVVGGRVSGLHI